jgi:hypothetical protein
MSEKPWVKWYAGDFLQGVADLEPSEGWVYTVILMLIYDAGGPIKLNIKSLALPHAPDQLHQGARPAVRSGKAAHIRRICAQPAC